MTDTKTAPTLTATAAAKKDDAAADQAAKRDGFANAGIKAAASKAAAAKPRQSKVKAKPVDAAQAIAKLKEKATENIDAAIEKGDPLTVALGNDRGPSKVIEPEAVTLEPDPVRRGGKYQATRPIVHNTHTLPRTTQFTHVWLMQGQRPLDVNELGSPVGLNPGQQLEFKRGQLTFG
ncbi:hypothetical protein [Sphingopyxis granuli]|uniref:hypothetical protein n=1 Tax=Sphingopyxis granuli TaxID=267128 RepID=UPI001BAFE370|nr:hypothetical protein [Sphingopyxis granuli]QUM73337.1 hypothetical protein ICN83_05475 [Sphingopyxis granuli]